MGKGETTLPPMLDRVRLMTAHGRDKAAAVFDLGAVHDAISSAAAEGFGSVTIEPAKPLDLRDTATAKATVAALLAEGFRVEWAPQATKPGEALVQLLVVSW